MRLSFVFLLLPFLFVFCSGDDPAPTKKELVDLSNDQMISGKYLALGDSYTIGESVCETCRFPVQLKDSLQNENPDLHLTVDIIATTGWTTTNLKAAIQAQHPASDYDLVTLLIGVNNQYQHKPFSLYDRNFPSLSRPQSHWPEEIKTT